MSVTATHFIKSIRDTIRSEWQATDHLILHELVSDVPLIQEIAKHIVNSGGKRLRPLLVLLAASALDNHSDEAQELAAIVEFIHTATLLHDDVVDDSSLRRGRETANAIWGNQATVLVGDFLYSRAFQLLAKRSNVPVSHELAHATNALSEGEVMQLMRQTQSDLTENDYYAIIYRKTARLFEACTHIGGIISTTDETIHRALAEYGKHLGMAFQITDDVLDYTANANELGKCIGDDLQDGKTTLPLIHAMANAPAADKALIQQAIEQQSLETLADIQRIIEKTNTVPYCLSQATKHITKAVNALTPLAHSSAKESLTKIAHFVINRQT